MSTNMVNVTVTVIVSERYNYKSAERETIEIAVAPELAAASVRGFSDVIPDLVANMVQEMQAKANSKQEEKPSNE